MEEEIKKDPRICIDLALWDLERALSDLQDFIGLVRFSDFSDLKNCMVRINQIMLEVVNIKGRPINNKSRAIC